MHGILRRLDNLQLRSAPAAFVVAVMRKSSDDQAGYLASLLSYYAFLSVFPLLLVLVTVLGIVLRENAGAQQAVLHSALVDFPVIGTQLRDNIHSLNRTGFGLAVGLAGTFLGARGLSSAAQAAFNTVWSIPFTHRPSWLNRQVRGVGLLAVFATAVVATGAVSGAAGFGSGRPIPIEWVGAAVSTLMNCGLFVLGFRIATAAEVPTRCFARAAALTAIMWQILLGAGTYLVDHELRHAEALYGVFGLVLGLLAWLHIQTRVALWVLEADSVWARRLWPRSLSDDRIDPGDWRAYTYYARAQQRRAGMEISVSGAGMGSGEVGRAHPDRPDAVDPVH